MAAGNNVDEGELIAGAVAHEISHQFNIKDNTGGIMNYQIPLLNYHSSSNINIIRNTLKP